MEIRRTANAGVLLNMDDISLLIDGVCKDMGGYVGTPATVLDEIVSDLPDVVMYTHKHKDHYDEDFIRKYTDTTGKTAYGNGIINSISAGNVLIDAVPTRHIGKSDVLHISYIIRGSKCVWFMGDASPVELKNISGFPDPDVLIVPYAYAVTESSWRMVKGKNPKKIILLHLPNPQYDEYNLWDKVKDVTKNDELLLIPEIGEKIIF